jgi:L-ascorbate metabolism protein UlaG (beta-lactamase superfamily)
MHVAVMTERHHLVELLDRIEVPKRAVAIQFHCQVSIAIKAAGKVIYFDPWYSDFFVEALVGTPSATRRKRPPPLEPEDVANADYILITHDHLDHLDPGTVPAAARRSARSHFIVPQAGQKHLLALGVPAERITAIRIQEEETLSPLLDFGGFSVTAVKGNHDGFDYDPEHGYPWLGYILRINSLTFLHIGDTRPFDGQVEALKPFGVDVACLPINGGTHRTRSLGFKGNFNYQEAADIGVAIGADWIIPMHYGVMTDNDEKGYRFVEYIEERYPQQRFHMLRPGETIIYHKWS